MNIQLLDKQVNLKYLFILYKFMLVDAADMWPSQQ